ncbi:hypothetical protein WNB94_13110 [Aquabacterium sp. A3]|uniref:hypothetical protein n=1 Tax=Aquabacterium sp. A3 TaxID=3132829 RepID=UPI0031192A90
MGITIHFEGRLKGDSAYEALIHAAEQFALARGWQAKGFLVARTTLSRVRNGEDWNYEGPTKGIELQPHPSSEPIRLEFDENLFIQEYTKTQFAPPETHKELVLLLDQLIPLFESLEVIDEGQYFETRDEELLLNLRDQCFEMLDEHLANDLTLRGPVRLPSGRIADLVSDT